MSDQTSRRTLLVTGGLGLVATAALSAPAAARGMTDAEKANVKVVKDFLAAWKDPNIDIDKVCAQFFAPMASIRWTGDQPAVYGPAAAALQAKAAYPKGAWMEVKYNEVFAHGPVVSTSRVDTLKLPGQPDQPMTFAGVAVLKDGKIQEYVDYAVT